MQNSKWRGISLAIAAFARSVLEGPRLFSRKFFSNHYTEIVLIQALHNPYILHDAFVTVVVGLRIKGLVRVEGLVGF